MSHASDDDIADFLDGAPTSGEAAPVRDHVTFRSTAGASEASAPQPLEAAQDFVRWLKADAKAHGRSLNARAHASYSGAVTARVPWQGQRFHTVTFVALDRGRLLARHKQGRVLSRQLRDWLSASERFGDACWRTRDEYSAGEAGRATPGG